MVRYCRLVSIIVQAFDTRRFGVEDTVTPESVRCHGAGTVVSVIHLPCGYPFLFARIILYLTTIVLVRRLERNWGLFKTPQSERVIRPHLFAQLIMFQQILQISRRHGRENVFSSLVYPVLVQSARAYKRLTFKSPFKNTSS